MSMQFTVCIIEYIPEWRELLFSLVSLRTNFSTENRECLVNRRMFHLCVLMLSIHVQWEVNIFLEAILTPGELAIT